MVSHKFGGIWTQKKLSVLKDYLMFYATALQEQPFTLHYADAFAGTGTHLPDSEKFEQSGLLEPISELQGSVLTALESSPEFDQYHFNDINPSHVEALNQIKKDYQAKNIHIYQSDANKFVTDFCNSLNAKDRAVIFLDPYSTQLDWKTLEVIAGSRKADLWLLFPISVLLRLTPKDGSRIKSGWKETIDRLLGTSAWEEALYRPVEPSLTPDLFDDLDSTGTTERVNVEELENWVTSRLSELFPYVAKPVPLMNNGHPLFLFYFAVSNPNRKAWGLADRAVGYITKNGIQKNSYRSNSFNYDCSGVSRIILES